MRREDAIRESRPNCFSDKVTDLPNRSRNLLDTLADGNEECFRHLLEVVGRGGLVAGSMRVEIEGEVDGLVAEVDEEVVEGVTEVWKT